jgi:hypothetical protein
MGQRKYPPLKQSEMVAIFLALHFRLIRVGKHACYERPADAVRGRKVVPIDDYEEFDETLIGPMISESGFSREEFYGATKATAKKINLHRLFVPCDKCGKRLGDTKTCSPCISFLQTDDLI